MLDAPIPADDAQRVDALCRLNVLDTAPEERFDRITRTAQRLFEVPIALVSLVDLDRQWFKSRQGLEAPETPRNVSFCGHAILQEGAFVIADAHADPRFADNPLVTGPPHVRFYAGMPLHDRDGWRIGTLCLIDRAARPFTAQDEAALADLAGWAELELNVYTVEQATAIAREKEVRLQAILDHAGDAIVTLAADGSIQSYNRQAERLFDEASRSALGASVLDWVAPESAGDIGSLLAAGTDAAPGHGPLRRELLCRRGDGTVFPAEISVSELRGAGRAAYTLILRDVTERKQVEKMKNEFISTVSHELRTPLTSVRGSLGLLLGGAAGEIPAKARGLLDIAANNCDRLVRLINDMLDIEKIESGNVRFDVQELPLLPLVRQAINATQPFAQPLQVRLELLPTAVDAQVRADADRLTQVLVNLLSNAAKFSPAGGSVDVCVDWVQAATGPRRVRLTVADRGPGIPEEFRARMFSRFGQADASDVRAKSGTGLGLAISKAIVERLGGRIGFGDREGGGTVFHVDLPATAAMAQGQPSASVLVCEDDADIARLVCMLLERGGLRSDVAHDAQQARRMLAAHAYQAMTLDIGLPGEDGLSLLRWVRSQPGMAGLPVVVLSAREVPDGLDATAFGALDWLVKPIDEAHLLRAVRGALRGPRDRRPVVLHVEDDPDLREVVGTLLQDSCDAVATPTLAEARTRLEERTFDLILLDMQLPDGDGSELLAALPARNAATPVVIFSGNEVIGDTATQVRNALVKSRTSNAQLLALLHRLIGEGRQPTP
ncbi:MAG TPA: response regulator [Ramlibacter sp.]|nr:response regulator [Ramlibacter sp.]